MLLLFCLSLVSWANVWTLHLINAVKWSINSAGSSSQKKNPTIATIGVELYAATNRIEMFWKYSMQPGHIQIGQCNTVAHTVCHTVLEIPFQFKIDLIQLIFEHTIRSSIRHSHISRFFATFTIRSEAWTKNLASSLQSQSEVRSL